MKCMLLWQLKQIDRGIIKQLDYSLSFSFTRPRLTPMGGMLMLIQMNVPFDFCVYDNAIFIWHNYAHFHVQIHISSFHSFLFVACIRYDFTRTANWNKNNSQFIKNVKRDRERMNLIVIHMRPLSQWVTRVVRDR